MKPQVYEITETPQALKDMIMMAEQDTTVIDIDAEVVEKLDEYVDDAHFRYKGWTLKVYPVTRLGETFYNGYMYIGDLKIDGWTGWNGTLQGLLRAFMSHVDSSKEAKKNVFTF